MNATHKTRLERLNALQRTLEVRIYGRYAACDDVIDTQILLNRLRLINKAIDKIA
jgi:hypothetical protein